MGVAVGAGEGAGGVNVTLFFSSGEIPKTQWGGLVSLGLLTKEPQFSLLLDGPCISAVIRLAEEAELNPELKTKSSDCYKQA